MPNTRHATSAIHGTRPGHGEDDDHRRRRERQTAEESAVQQRDRAARRANPAYGRLDLDYLISPRRTQ